MNIILRNYAGLAAGYRTASHGNCLPPCTRYQRRARCSVGNPKGIVVPLVLLLGLTILGIAERPLEAAQLNSESATGSIVDNHARFTVITSTLIRLEYNQDKKFVNDRSYFAWHRQIKPPEFSVKKRGGQLIINTARMKLRYRSGASGFTAKNLSIQFRYGENKWRTWTPGLMQSGNLGGTLGSLDGCNGPEPLSNGVLSIDGWYLLRDHTLLVTDGPHPWIKPRPASETADWYFFGYGRGHYHTALRDLTTVSGRVPIPPRYMLGSWRSRYHSFTAKQFKQLVLEYDSHHIPLDVMVMDMGWHTTPHWGSYNWNRKLIPHPRQLLAWLHKHGLHVTLNLHPQSGIGPWDSQFKEFCQAMGLDAATTKRIGFEPASQRSMRNFYKLLLDPLEKQGVDFWWLDWGDQYLGWVNALDFWNIGRSTTGHRGASFSRWGGWGNQRYPISFSGDTRSRWRVLRFEVPFVATGGNVGADYWSNDIGGFAVFLPRPELYARWIQFGALSPIFRTHSEGGFGEHRVPWYYGRRTLAAARVGYDLRSRLFPYIYTCAYDCWKHSLPLIRPLYLSYPAAPQAYSHPGEYQFGPSLLVSPVVSRGVGKAWLGATDMWFPRGTWWNILTHESVEHTGDRPVLASANEIPVFARGGVPIPMQRLTLRMAEKPVDPLVVCVYPGPNGKSILYEDDGLSPDYLRGAYALTPLHYQHLGTGSIRVTVGPTLGSYLGQPHKRKVIIRLPVTTVPKEVFANGKPVAESASGIPGYSYNPVAVTTEVRLPDISIHRQAVVTVQFSGSPAVRALLPKVLNRIALVHRALAGAGQERIGWKFKLDRLLFHLQTLRSVAAQVFGPASAATIRSGLGRANGELVGIQGSLAQHHSAQSLAGEFALSNIFLSAARKLRDAGAGVLPYNQHRYYKTYSGVNNIEHYQVGLLLHALVPASAGQVHLSVDIPSLAHRNFTFSKIRRSHFVFLPVLAANDHPLYSFSGRAVLRISPEISANRRVRFCRRTLDQWRIVGPFTPGKVPQLGDAWITPAVLDKSFTGKSGKSIYWISAQRAVRHLTQYSRRRWINVRRLYSVNNASAVAVTWIKASVPVTCQLSVRHEDGITLWVNQRRYLNKLGAYDMSDPADIVRVRLNAGWNQFVVQTDRIKWAWGFSVRLKGPNGVVFSQSTQPPEPGRVVGRIIAPPHSSAEHPIDLSKGTSDWAYFDYFSHHRSTFEHKAKGVYSIEPAKLGSGQPPSTSTDSRNYIGFSNGAPNKALRSLQSFAYAGGNHQAIEFKHVMLAQYESVRVYLTSFDAKTDLSVKLGSKVLFRKRAVVLGKYYDPQKDGDGTGSGHGYAVLELEVHGAVGDLLTVQASVDLRGVKHQKYGSVGFQAVAVMVEGK